ncbi:MAG: hypothetical protein IPJ14_01025 [Kineosporiaceae bacterium]|nr:hypothetical protein [Kineosporiaceae bacterium]MBK7621267.1 hypothetical protein [Kineosporiaceae bacterium]MBK8077578.1 hypothetical protein [Kineosporiaceae bacterium]
MNHRARTARLTAVGVLAFLLLNYPLLSVADHEHRVFGVPVLWLYLFGVWSVLILVLRAIVRRTE